MMTSSFSVTFFVSEGSDESRFGGTHRFPGWRSTPLRAANAMSTRGAREAQRTQAHVLTGRVRRWQRVWIRGADATADVLRWTPVVDVNGGDVESTPNQKRSAFEIVPLAECVVLLPTAKPTAAEGAVNAVAAAVAAAGGGTGGTPPAKRPRR